MISEKRNNSTLHYLTISWISLVLLCSLLLPSPGTLGAKGSASDNDIPTWYQGDQWTYTIDPLSFQSPNGSFTGTVSNLQETVMGITGDAYELSITGQITGTITISGLQGDLSGGITGTSYQRISDLAQETTVLHSDGTIFYLISFPYVMDLVMNSTPPVEAFDFPINAGELWQISSQSTTAGSFSIASIFEQSLNGSQFVDETVQCDTQEQVSVPAGTFDCFRITRSSADVWYSADAGNIVKSSIDESGENVTVHATLALQSYSRSSQPITISEDIEPSVVIPESQVTISGQAHNTQTGDPIKNTEVLISIPSLHLNWTTVTDNTGLYTKEITAPTMVDDTPSGRETGSGGVIVQCTSGSLTGYHVQTLVTITNVAPTPPSVSGPSKGKPGVAYPFTVLSTDVDGDMVFYFIDWGDNSSTGWQGPYNPGVTLTFNHTFAAKGTYTIKAEARDTYGAESGWSTLRVKMPISTTYEPHRLLSILERFFERHPYAFPLLRSLLGFDTAMCQS